MPDETKPKVETHAPATAAAPRRGAGGKRFVVLHTQVGAHENGAVLNADQLGDEGNVQRLVQAGAVREANKDEADLERVTFPETPTSAALESQLAAKHQEVQELVAEKQELLAKLDVARRLAGPQPPQPQSEPIQQLMKNKDQVIEELRSQNEQLKRQIDDPTAPPPKVKAADAKRG